MAEIEIPFPFGDLPLKPELTGKIKVSDEITQTLATLLGWDGSSRKLLRTALSGCLNATTPQVKAITQHTSPGPNIQYTGLKGETTEVMLLALSTNDDIIWVDIGVIPHNEQGWPLAAGDILNISLDNLDRLNFYIHAPGDTLVVMHTR